MLSSYTVNRKIREVLNTLCLGKGLEKFNIRVTLSTLYSICLSLGNAALFSSHCEIYLTMQETRKRVREGRWRGGLKGYSFLKPNLRNILFSQWHLQLYFWTKGSCNTFVNFFNQAWILRCVCLWGAVLISSLAVAGMNIEYTQYTSSTYFLFTQQYNTTTYSPDIHVHVQ